MSEDRRQQAYATRVAAAELARSRPTPAHQANGDELRYASAHYAMSFTKGLEHDKKLGLVANPDVFRAFRQAIDDGYIDPFTVAVPATLLTESPMGRPWEAPTAGVVFDLQGPDAQAVTMPPAPALGTDELAFEMAEVYELALLRDVPLVEFDAGANNSSVTGSLKRLNGYGYARAGFPDRPRLTDGGQLTAGTAFRGSSPGVGVGPYLSQFLCIGNQDQPGATTVSDGKIVYGAQLISQKVPVAEEGKDYLQTWKSWLAAQEGKQPEPQVFSKGRRFIQTPRDLATYVHFDALYQAYLNATLILLGMKTPFDPAFDALSGGGTRYAVTNRNKANQLGRQAGGFALYGGPHILTLVTEVATRALKAVRYQKFNAHLRLRPEALSARVEKSAALDAAYPALGGRFTALSGAIDETVQAVRMHNGGRKTALLPMAFPEGSPMHPSYGAGHATVAGACVTVLKAFFDTGTFLVRDGANAKFAREGKPVHYTVAASGQELACQDDGPTLTLEGELNKLAANISIGRNMAGVHYFSDYFDSLRMGEEIAIGLLQEQALCYPTDRFVLTLPTFDGPQVRIGAR